VSQQWSSPHSAVPESSGTATGSLIAGILSFIVCPIVLSIVAIILGNQAKEEIRASGGRIAGEGSAQAGIVLGWISIVVFAITLLLAAVIIAT